MHAGRAQVDDSVSAATFIYTSYNLPPSTAMSIEIPVPLSRQTCCGVEVADKEKRLDTTDTTIRKEEPGKGFVYRGL
jgi:hypothetical protein